MLESWLQYTCDGCGETEYSVESNVTRSHLRSLLKKAGWHRLMQTIRFVCDTQAEGDRLYKLGWDQIHELNGVRAKYEKQLAELVVA